MAALTATFWTESVEERVIMAKKKRNRVKLTLSSTQAGTYPSSGGIPLPTTLGMVRNIDYINIIQAPYTTSGAIGAADNVVWAYVVSDHAIHGYWAEYPTAAGGASQLQELATTWKASTLGTAPVMYVEVVGW